jgi:sigma-E factor negative regulatory protein RseA
MAVMTERLRESLSALMDDEADDLELGRVLRAMEEDGEVRATWARYQLVSAVLRGHGAGGAEPLDALLTEQPPATPVDGHAAGAADTVATVPETAARQSAWRPWASFAVAASLTVAAVVAWPTRQDEPALPETAEVAAPRGESLVLGAPGAPRALRSSVRPVRERFLVPERSPSAGPAAPDARVPLRTLPGAERHARALMLQHAELSALHSRAGMMPFTRVAAFEQAP